MSGLVMDSAPGKVRYIVLGGIVAVFAIGILIATHGSKNAPPAAPAQKQEASVDAAASAAMPAEAPPADTQPAVADAAATATPTASIDDAASTAPAAAVATTATADAVAPQAVAAAPAPAPAAVAPQAQMAQPVAPPPSAAPVEQSDAVAPNELSSEPAPVRHKAAVVEKPRPAVRPPPPPALAVLQPWWREAGAARDFNVQYVGQAASEQALVFRFSKGVAGADVAARNIRVLDDKGVAVQGQWSTGATPYVLIYRGVTSGRYTVRIAPTLASASGIQLGTSLQGAVFVR